MPLVPSPRAKVEGVDQQRVARQNGQGLAEHLMVGGPAAPEIVIVHAGQIVMDQGKGMRHLQGAGREEDVLARAVAGLERSEGQGRAQAFAAREGGIADRLMQIGRGFGFRRQVTLQSRVHAQGCLLEVILYRDSDLVLWG
jgi:hypothetical protein